jgi:hypothetical protein
VQRQLVARLKRDLLALESHPQVQRTAYRAERPEWSSLKQRREAIERIAIELEADPVADKLAAMEREAILDQQLADLKARLAHPTGEDSTSERQS